MPEEAAAGIRFAGGITTATFRRQQDPGAAPPSLNRVARMRESVLAASRMSREAFHR